MYSKTIYLHNIKINFRCNDFITFLTLCEQLKFPKFKNYNKYIRITLNLCIKKDELKYGRQDIAFSEGKGLSLDCWLKNISVRLNTKRNRIDAQLIQPSILPVETLLHLIIISPLRQILKYHNIFLIHSAVVAKSNKALIICAKPGLGKSTLATFFLSAGYGFLSDEFAIIKDEKIWSFPLKIKLDLKSIKSFKSNRNNKLPHSFYAQDIFKANIPECCIPQIMLFIQRSKHISNPVQIKPLNMQQGFELLAGDKENGLTDEKNTLFKRHKFQALTCLIQKTKCYNIKYSLNQAQQIPQLINKLL